MTHKKKSPLKRHTSRTSSSTPQQNTSVLANTGISSTPPTSASQDLVAMPPTSHLKRFIDNVTPLIPAILLIGISIFIATIIYYYAGMLIPGIASVPVWASQRKSEGASSTALSQSPLTSLQISTSLALQQQVLLHTPATNRSLTPKVPTSSPASSTQLMLRTPTTRVTRVEDATIATELTFLRDTKTQLTHFLATLSTDSHRSSFSLDLPMHDLDQLEHDITDMQQASSYAVRAETAKILAARASDLRIGMHELTHALDSLSAIETLTSLILAPQGDDAALQAFVANDDIQQYLSALHPHASTATNPYATIIETIHGRMHYHFDSIKENHHTIIALAKIISIQPLSYNILNFFIIHNPSIYSIMFDKDNMSHVTLSNMLNSSFFINVIEPQDFLKFYIGAIECYAKSFTHNKNVDVFHLFIDAYLLRFPERTTRTQIIETLMQQLECNPAWQSLHASFKTIIATIERRVYAANIGMNTALEQVSFSHWLENTSTNYANLLRKIATDIQKFYADHPLILGYRLNPHLWSYMRSLLGIKSLREIPQGYKDSANLAMSVFTLQTMRYIEAHIEDYSLDRMRDIFYVGLEMIQSSPIVLDIQDQFSNNGPIVIYMTNLFDEESKENNKIFFEVEAYKRLSYITYDDINKKFSYEEVSEIVEKTLKSIGTYENNKFQETFSQNLARYHFFLGIIPPWLAMTLGTAGVLIIATFVYRHLQQMQLQQQRQAADGRQTPGTPHTRSHQRNDRPNNRSRITQRPHSSTGEANPTATSTPALTWGDVARTYDVIIHTNETDNNLTVTLSLQDILSFLTDNEQQLYTISDLVLTSSNLQLNAQSHTRLPSRLIGTAGKTLQTLLTIASELKTRPCSDDMTARAPESFRRLATYLLASGEETHLENKIQLRHLLHLMNPELGLVDPVIITQARAMLAPTPREPNKPPQASSTPSQPPRKKHSQEKPRNNTSSPADQGASSSSPVTQAARAARVPTPVKSSQNQPAHTNENKRASQSSSSSSAPTPPAQAKTLSKASIKSKASSFTSPWEQSSFYLEITQLIKQVNQNLKKMYPTQVAMHSLTLDLYIFNYIHHLHTQMRHLPKDSYCLWTDIRDMWVHRAHELSTYSLRDKVTLINDIALQLAVLEQNMQASKTLLCLITDNIHRIHNMVDTRLPPHPIFNSHTQEGLTIAVAGVINQLRLWQALLNPNMSVGALTKEQVFARLTIVLCKYLRKITDSTALLGGVRLPKQHHRFDYSLREHGRNALAHPQLPLSGPEEAYAAFEAWNKDVVAHMQAFMQKKGYTTPEALERLIQDYCTLLGALSQRIEISDSHHVHDENIAASSGYDAKTDETPTSTKNIVSEGGEAITATSAGKPSSSVPAPVSLPDVPSALFAHQPKASPPQRTSLSRLSATSEVFIPPSSLPSPAAGAVNPPSHIPLSAVGVNEFIPPSFIPLSAAKAEEFTPPPLTRYP